VYKLRVSTENFDIFCGQGKSVLVLSFCSACTVDNFEEIFYQIEYLALKNTDMLCAKMEEFVGVFLNGGEN
jgi:hypothetical protein